MQLFNSRKSAWSSFNSLRASFLRTKTSGLLFLRGREKKRRQEMRGAFRRAAQRAASCWFESDLVWVFTRRQLVRPDLSLSAGSPPRLRQRRSVCLRNVKRVTAKGRKEPAFLRLANESKIGSSANTGIRNSRHLISIACIFKIVNCAILLYVNKFDLRFSRLLCYAIVNILMGKYHSSQLNCNLRILRKYLKI